MIDAGNGPAMGSELVAKTLADLQVTKSHSRPHCSNDNPFIEAHFKTMKYSSSFPDRFESIEDTREFCDCFFHRYNQQMYHSGFKMLTPETVYYGRAAEVISHRQLVLDDAYTNNPERCIKGPPVRKQLPPAVCINEPVSAQKLY